MNFLGSLVSFLLIWWVVLFMVLPLRIEKNKDTETKGIDRGAPDQHQLPYKMGLTTILSLVLWGILYTLIQTGVLTYEIWI